LSEFTLDSRLEADTQFLLDWPLCRVLLMNDSQYPWCILVPRVLDSEQQSVTELFHLDDVQRAQLDKESMALSHSLMSVFSPDKLNIAALGNVVSQLHIHHVARYTSDAAWPAPVWGRLPVKPYDDAMLRDLVVKLSTVLSEALSPK